MSLTPTDLKRLVRRGQVIGHPLVKILAKARRDGRAWSIARQNLAWLPLAWPHYQGLLAQRLDGELAELVQRLETVGPRVDLEPGESNEEVETYVAWFMDVASRANLPFALGALYGSEDTLAVVLGAQELPSDMTMLPLNEELWGQILAKINLAEAREGVAASQVLVGRLFEYLLDTIHLATCPQCGLPMRLLNETGEQFWCKKCQREVSLL